MLSTVPSASYALSHLIFMSTPEIGTGITAVLQLRKQTWRHEVVCLLITALGVCPRSGFGVQARLHCFSKELLWAGDLHIIYM